MDALSDVLRVAHLTGGVFLHADFFAPWCMAARVGPEHCAPALGPASHLILSVGRLVWEKGHQDLLRALAEFPRVVSAAATLREPHRVARFLEDTAASYHRFYDGCRVLPLGDEEAQDLHRARLRLVEATRVVLANGLALLGVSAPERM